ncbi:uncharacterized protein BP01DRAFT_364913 [Aspergillus saccharolyticus JOP 1030-1]|uniref:Uncharacterized protein n=1 Tax=Aspergillus saccharolyticus JOP 1030-1 TaxID=1450539 RepID=A0A318ZFE6_9EURO|nr:hypothetical protein BP01DRAFT_364913 [Aspergillus saccharolyticus JOP 1030-1]PYH46139.1 hypothetical protein BP01DRAFT_364913 [Aspergillus saccharolyticus JOP 1030-1]
MTCPSHDPSPGRIYTRKIIAIEPSHPPRTKKRSRWDKFFESIPEPLLDRERPHEVVDRNSGQVYLQSFEKPSRALSKGASWVHETPFLPEGWKGWEEANARGAPSLRHAAMRQALSDQRDLRPELFVSIPWRIAKSLWDCLGKCKKQTSHAWKVFATAYPEEFRQLAPHRVMKVENPLMAMQDYLGLVRSESLSWKATLTLAATHARVPDLVGLANIPNLVALEIATPLQFEGVQEESEAPMVNLNDRIVRSWAELAQTSKGLANLRVLMLQHQSEISSAALRYLHDLPALQFLVLNGCRVIPVGATVGLELEGWAVVDIGEVPKSLHAIYTKTLEIDGAEQSSLPAEAPMFSLQVGQKTLKVLRATSKQIHQAVGYDPICLRRIKGYTDRPVKRLKAAPPQSSAGPKRAVMKERKLKDLGGMLQDFL